MILRLRKIAIVDINSSPYDVVNLISINEGVDGSSVFGLSNEHNEFNIDDNQTYIDSANPELDVRVLKPSSTSKSFASNSANDLSLLESWANNQTDVHVYGLTLDGAVNFGAINGTNPVTGFKITANEQLSDNDVFAFKVTKKTTPSFSDTTSLHQNGFFAGNNIIGYYEWANNDDSGISGLADGWARQSMSSVSFSNGVQTLVFQDGVQGEFLKDSFFPFSNTTVNFFFTVDSESGTTSGNVIRVDEYDQSGNLLDFTTDNFTGTGLKSISFTTGSDVVYITPQIRSTGSGGTYTLEVRDPCLRIDGKTTYTKL